VRQPLSLREALTRKYLGNAARVNPVVRGQDVLCIPAATATMDLYSIHKGEMPRDWL